AHRRPPRAPGRPASTVGFRPATVGGGRGAGWSPTRRARSAAAGMKPPAASVLPLPSRAVGWLRLSSPGKNRPGISTPVPDPEIPKEACLLAAA
ncbi:unnamed protein product, partial [Urochloa humidicola]